MKYLPLFANVRSSLSGFDLIILTHGDILSQLQLKQIITRYLLLRSISVSIVCFFFQLNVTYVAFKTD